jgi:hypothetical protein
MSDHPITGMAFLIMSLRKQIATITEERDQARRMYCGTISDHVDPYRIPEDIAADRGWDCYKEDGK